MDDSTILNINIYFKFVKTLDICSAKRYNLSVSNQPRLQSLINIGDIMENEEHFDLVDFIESVLAVDEADKEIEEDINPLT